MEVEIHKIVKNIKGFLDEEEGHALYATALEASCSGPCLEIGSYCGKSAVYLGMGCKETGGVLFSIDHHQGSEEQQPGEEYFDPELFDPQNLCVDTFRAFRNTLEAVGLEETVVPIVCRSEVASRLWSTPLSLVFIDGGHSFEAALTDYKSWSRHILPDGYLLIHDIFKDPQKGGRGGSFGACGKFQNKDQIGVSGRNHRAWGHRCGHGRPGAPARRIPLRAQSKGPYPAGVPGETC